MCICVRVWSLRFCMCAVGLVFDFVVIRKDSVCVCAGAHVRACVSVVFEVCVCAVFDDCVCVCA